MAGKSLHKVYFLNDMKVKCVSILFNVEMAILSPTINIQYIYINVHLLIIPFASFHKAFFFIKFIDLHNLL